MYSLCELDEEENEEKEMFCIPCWIEYTIDFSNIDSKKFPKIWEIVKEYQQLAEKYFPLSDYPSQLHKFDRKAYVVKLIDLDYAIDAVTNFLKKRLGIDDLQIVFSFTELDENTAKEKLQKQASVPK